jgi:hypothetical protein
MAALMASERMIEGLEECCADLLRLKPAVCGVAVTRGLHAAGEVIEAAIDVRTPVRTNRIGGDKDYPSLITDLSVKVTLDSGGRGGLAEVGFFKQAYVAQWVEYGHRMVGHSPGKKNQGSVPAHPFLRPAADASEDAAVEAFIGSVNNSLAEFSEEAA